MTDLSRPCQMCARGNHICTSALCGCLADHADDGDMMRGFKRLKRQMHPEREAWVAGGWKRPAIRVQAEVGERLEGK